MIVFKRITFKNFLSSGNAPVTINLNDHKTTLIHGVNGTGKSTVLDAICFALFNKPFRGINIPQLVNSSNKKGLLSEIEFEIGSNNYVVTRGIKPKVFDILVNGEPLKFQASNRDNQNYLEQNILKMNYKSFIQCVILGTSSYVPFMQLSSSARRDCIEDFLDIKVFSAMSLLAKDRLRGLKETLRECKGDMSNLEYKIDLQKDRITEIEQQSVNDVEELQSLIESYKTEVDVLNKDIKKLQAKDTQLMNSVNELMNSSPKKMHQQYNEVIIKMKSKLETINKEGEFFKNNHECPSCSQVISNDIKETVLAEKTEESKKYSLAVVQAQSKLEEFGQILSKVQELETKIQVIHNQVHIKQAEMNSHNKNIMSYETKLVNITTDSSTLDKERGKVEALEEQMSDLVSTHNEFLGLINEHEIIVNLLKDSGIKTQIVRKYLPVMNKLIRKYLTDLDFPIHFTLDEEFSETVSSPMYQDFSYGSFSEGQKSRIDLSLLLTWREIGKLKNSVSVNLLILDEVFSSSLDQTGKELLFALLKFGMDDTQKILVVDHTLDAAFKEKFDHSIEVSKVGGFSKYS